VFFAGGGGSLLLMQPESIDVATSKLHITFMIASSTARLIDEPIVDSSAAARERPSTQAHVLRSPTLTPSGRPHRGHTVPAVRHYWIYDWPADA
jgi:hypothetical protein